jgi:phage-related protein
VAARYRVVYYRTDSGREPVAEWLDGRTSREQAKLFWALERLAESGFLLGPPWLKKLDDDIWEVRVQHGHLYARILFYERTKRVFVLLHAFAKRSQRTPKRKLHTARARLMADWESHAE